MVSDIIRFDHVIRSGRTGRYAWHLGRFYAPGGRGEASPRPMTDARPFASIVSKTAPAGGLADAQ